MTNKDIKTLKIILADNGRCLSVLCENCLFAIGDNKACKADYIPDSWFIAYIGSFMDKKSPWIHDIAEDIHNISKLMVVIGHIVDDEYSWH